MLKLCVSGRCIRGHLRSNDLSVHKKNERSQRCMRDQSKRIACQPHRIICARMSSKPHAKRAPRAAIFHIRTACRSRTSSAGRASALTIRETSGSSPTASPN